MYATHWITFLLISQFYSRWWKYIYFFKFKNVFIFWKVIIIRFLNVGPDPRLQYEGSGLFLLGGGWGGGIFPLFFFGGVVMPLGQAKNSDIKTFGNKSSIAANERLIMDSWGVQSFSFWEGQGRNLLPFPPCSHHSPYMFPSAFSCSQVVPQSFPIAFHFLSQYDLPKIQLSCI